MGCCQSTDRDGEDASPARSEPPGGSAHEASRQYDSPQAPIINHPSRSRSNAGSSTVPSTYARPNKPIRPPTPLKSSPADVSSHQPPWTRSHLEREREIFFETRTSGDDETWKALRVVCESLRRKDIAEAQAFLDALNLTCPEGRVAQGRGKNREKGGLFNEFGANYSIPAWVVTDPLDIVEDEEKEGDDKEEEEEDDDDYGNAVAGADHREEDGERNNNASAPPAMAPAAAAPAAAAAAAAAQQPREEKGKGRAEDVGERVRLRVRLSDRGTDIVVQVGTNQKIATIVRAIQAQIGERRLRLMYLGKTLDERKTLEQTNWTPGHVINGLVYLGDEEVVVGQRRETRTAGSEAKRL